MINLLFSVMHKTRSGSSFSQRFGFFYTSFTVKKHDWADRLKADGNCCFFRNMDNVDVITMYPDLDITDLDQPGYPHHSIQQGQPQVRLWKYGFSPRRLAILLTW